MDRQKLRLTALAALGVAAAACGTTRPAAATHSHPFHITPAPTLSHQAASTQKAIVPAPTTTTTTTSAAAVAAPPAPAGGVNTADPNAVADAMLEATFTVNTVTDQSPFAAVRRSLGWYTPAEANQVLASDPTGSPGAQWITWTQHHVTTTVAVSAPQGDAGAPPDQPTLVHRIYIVTQTPTGTGGWTAPPVKYICYVTLARNGTGPWQVSSLQVDPDDNTQPAGG